MPTTRKLNRFPKGERCPSCGASKWYLDSGRRFCQNGDMIEGFVQYDNAEEEDMGKKGRTFRKDKDGKAIETRKLMGTAGQSLYIESLQLILRQQLEWLIETKGYTEELETVVRDLWDIRLRGAPINTETAASDGSEREMPIYSSQSEPDHSNGDSDTPAPGIASYRWGVSNARRWPNPKPLDTLALCYLGGHLLRLPLRIGQIQRWAVEDHLPFGRAFDGLPKEVQDRMPQVFRLMLDYPSRNPLRHGDLHRHVRRLVACYREAIGIEFPSLDPLPLLIQCVTELGLPAEVVKVSFTIARLLNMDFSYPPKRYESRMLDYPEVAAYAIIVVGAKCVLSLGSNGSLIRQTDATCVPYIDWKAWTGSENATPKKPDYLAATVEDVMKMGPVDFDGYLRHVSSFLEQEFNDSLEVDFPLNLSISPQVKTEPEEADHNLLEQAQKRQRDSITYGIASGDQLGQKETSKSPLYPTWPDKRYLSGTVEKVYELLAEASGLTITQIASAVFQCETDLVRWKEKQVIEETGNI